MPADADLDNDSEDTAPTQASSITPSHVMSTLVPIIANANVAIVSTLAVTPTTFHGFPKLPLELRNMIWGFAAPSRRHITVSTKVEISQLRWTKGWKIMQSQFTLDRTFYNLMWTCRDSRAIARMNFSPKPRIRTHRGGRPIWLDYSFDHLYLKDNDALDYIADLHGKQFEYPASRMDVALFWSNVENVILDEDDRLMGRLIYTVPKLTGLKNLTVMVQDRDSDSKLIIEARVRRVLGFGWARNGATATPPVLTFVTGSAMIAILPAQKL